MCTFRSLFCVISLLLLSVPATAQVNATLHVDESRLQGTHPNGSLLLYTPDPLEPGSSMSHWEPSATPNLLMEPFINPDLPFLDLDVTPAMMQDIFWELGSSNINIYSFDDEGTGFTDPTPFEGAPGNTAATLGEARQNLFTAILGTWANTVDSSVDIDVVVVWAPLDCEAGVGAVLGSATTMYVFSGDDFPLPGTWFHSALAEALAKEDMSGAPEIDGDDIFGGDIIVFMNSSVDQGCLGPGTAFYYGLDGPPPANGIYIAQTLLHELGHGLGFQNLTFEEDGMFLEGQPGVFDHFTFDNTMQKYWTQMTDAERVASAANPRQVTWAGQAANLAASMMLDHGVPELDIQSPAAVAGAYNIGTASFGAPIPQGGISGQIECMVDDNPDPTKLNGCTAAVNPGDLSGKIALIDRGNCTFPVKLANAQAAGAVAAIIVNTKGDDPLELGGDDSSITIPAVSVGRTDGNRIRQAACSAEAAFFGGDRFQVTADWVTPDESGTAKAVRLTEDSGYFWFFDEDNIEVTMKMLDACGMQGFNNFWFFAAGMTDVEVNLTVVDTENGAVRQYANAFGKPFQPIQDTAAFNTCP